MRSIKWIVAVAGFATLLAGCVDDRYPNNQASNRSDRYWNSPNRDADRDGVPNRYDRDANGDGVPDRYQVPRPPATNLPATNLTAA
jgi:hypothetical protein